MPSASPSGKFHLSRNLKKRDQISELVVDGLRLQIIRKDIKNVHLRVYPPDGKVIVSAPRWLSVKDIASIVGARREWLEVQKTSCTFDHLEPDYADGEVYMLAGQPQTLRVNETKRHQSVKISDPGFIDMRVRGGSTPLQRRMLLEDFYREKLMEQAVPLVEKWELKLGVEVYELRIKRMTSRWGSCNVTDHRVWLSLALATKPVEFVEYVVVHELAHLIEHGHGPKFVRVMDEALKDWRSRKRHLNNV